MSTDPAVRYSAGAILVLAFLGALAVCVHGYWDNASYAVPSLIFGILMSGVTTAAALLGVHLGTAGTNQTVQTTSNVTSTAATAATAAAGAATAAAVKEVTTNGKGTH